MPVAGLDFVVLFHGRPAETDPVPGAFVEVVQADFRKQFCSDYRLTTAEIFYHMPDYPDFLQSYIWQEYDIAPKFPVLYGFLDFWNRELDGKVHSVYVASQKLITPSDARFYNLELTLQ